MKKILSPVVAPSAAVALFLVASSVQGATLTWDNGGASPVNPVDGFSSAWDTSAAIWSDGTTDFAWANGNNDTAVFGNSHGTAGTVNLGSDVVVGGLTFNASSSGAYTIAPGTGPYKLTLAGGSTITANADATISTVIVGSTGLTKSGAGTLTLSATNTYTGVTKITAGTLAVSSTTALGAIATSGTLAIDGGTFRYAPTTAGSMIVKYLSVGTNGATLEAGSTGLTIVNFQYTGSGARTVTLTGNGGTSPSNVGGTIGQSTSTTEITDSGGVTSLIKDGNGTWTLTGTNSYTGTTTVKGGILNLGGANRLATTGTVYMASSGTLNIGNYNQTFAELNDYNTGVTGALISSYTTGTGTLIVGGGSFSGTIRDWSGNPAKCVALTKNGSGTLTLSGTSLYSGLTSVTGGTLKFAAVKAMNFGMAIVKGVAVPSTAVSGGGVVDLGVNNGVFNQAITLNGGGLINSTAGTTATLDNGIAGVQFSNGGSGFSGNNSFTFTGGGGTGAAASYTVSSGSIGSVTTTAAGTGYTSAPTVKGASGNTSSDVTAILSSVSLTGVNNTIGGDGNLIIAAAINGAGGGFSKTGNGTLTLKGVNTYDGVTDITAGKLALASTGSIANSATIKVGQSAIFDVSAVSGFTIGGLQTLDNRGSIVGSVSVQGTLSGNGSISGGLSMLTNSTLDLQLNQSGGAHDTMTVLDGDVSLKGVLDLVLNGGSLQVGSGLMLIINEGSGALTESFSGVTINHVAVESFADHSFTYGGQEYALVTTSANVGGPINDLELIAVPEPNTWAMIAGGAGVLIGLQRLRRTGHRGA